MPQNELQKNADRFTGFADVYDRARPSVPEYPAKVVAAYLGRRPETVVDLGCGTGLSTLVWKGRCDRVIGVEPSADMLAVARQKADETVCFQQGFGNDTGLPSDFADAVVCSQSFHWMEPMSTLREADRILKGGGVFVTVDCDWPPVATWQAEQAYMQFYNAAKALEKSLPDVKSSFVRYPKEKHLQNMQNSGLFCYCREIVFANTERCNAQRLIDLMQSQGSVQTVLKLHPEQIKAELEMFSQKMRDLLGEREFDIDFCYRMRIGVKK